MNLPKGVRRTIDVLGPTAGDKEAARSIFLWFLGLSVVVVMTSLFAWGLNLIIPGSFYTIWRTYPGNPLGLYSSLFANGDMTDLVANVVWLAFSGVLAAFFLIWYGLEHPKSLLFLFILAPLFGGLLENALYVEYAYTVPALGTSGVGSLVGGMLFAITVYGTLEDRPSQVALLSRGSKRRSVRLVNVSLVIVELFFILNAWGLINYVPGTNYFVHQSGVVMGVVLIGVYVGVVSVLRDMEAAKTLDIRYHAVAHRSCLHGTWEHLEVRCGR